MTRPRPGPVLRNLAVLALAAPAACAIENPAFMLDSNTGTSSETTTRPTSTSTSTDATTDEVDTRTSTAGITGSGPTVTSEDPPVSTTVDASATSETTLGDTSPDTTTGASCEPMMKEYQAEADAFFIAGGTGDLVKTCIYLDPIIGSGHPCKLLNFGTTMALRLLRSSFTYEGMYAVRFVKSDLAALADMGVKQATAELVLTLYDDTNKAVTLQVGKLNVQWAEGLQNGMLADGGDSSFSEREHGFAFNPWSEPVNDGPRGASSPVAKIFVPAIFMDHDQFPSETFDIDDWLASPDTAEGLVVSFIKDDAKTTDGPGIKAKDFPELGYRPILRVRYCLPQP